MGIKLDPNVTDQELIQEEQELNEILSDEANRDNKFYWVWYMKREMVWKEMENRKK